MGEFLSFVGLIAIAIFMVNFGEKYSEEKEKALIEKNKTNSEIIKENERRALLSPAQRQQEDLDNQIRFEQERAEFYEKHYEEYRPFNRQD